MLALPVPSCSPRVRLTKQTTDSRICNKPHPAAPGRCRIAVVASKRLLDIRLHKLGYNVRRSTKLIGYARVNRSSARLASHTIGNSLFETLTEQ